MADVHLGQLRSTAATPAPPLRPCRSGRANRRKSDTSLSEQLPDQRPNPEDECRNSELSTRLTHFHGQLSPTLRRTFQLRAIDGLSIRETARILGVPIGTVKAQLARARKRLKELMRSALRARSRSLRDDGLGCGRSATSHRCSGGTHGLSSHGSSAKPLKVEIARA